MKSLVTLITTASTGAAVAFSAAHAKAWINRREHQKKKEVEAFMDTTRPGNDSFGINWGFQADSMVKFISRDNGSNRHRRYILYERRLFGVSFWQ